MKAQAFNAAPEEERQRRLKIPGLPAEVSTKAGGVTPKDTIE
jgi:hypothetical protein